MKQLIVQVSLEVLRNGDQFHILQCYCNCNSQNYEVLMTGLTVPLLSVFRVNPRSTENIIEKTRRKISSTGNAAPRRQWRSSMEIAFYEYGYCDIIGNQNYVLPQT